MRLTKRSMTTTKVETRTRSERYKAQQCIYQRIRCRIAVKSICMLISLCYCGRDNTEPSDTVSDCWQ